MLETAISKLFCSEGLWTVVDDALQIWGGEGYMRETGLERMLRDARINRIVEGATEVMTAFVALAGMKGVGEEFEQVLRASKHPVGNFGRLARFAQDQWRDIIVGPPVPDLHHDLHDQGESLARLTKLLARAVERVLMKYHEQILDMQLIQQRIAGAVIHLYAMAAVISKLQSLLQSHHLGEGTGHGRFQRDIVVGKGFCRRAEETILRHMQALTENHDDDVFSVADAVLR